MASSSIKLIDTLEWAKRFIFQRPTAQGKNNEPALTSANTILQTILGAPFAWRWNRAVTGFLCVPGQQDYTIFNWNASTQVALGTVFLDNNGNSQRVTVAGTTGSSYPTWNPTSGQTTTDGGVTWTNSGAVGLSGGVISYKFGWMETVSVKAQYQNSGEFAWKAIESSICLDLDSAQSRPHHIAAQLDDGQGNITFRLMPVPDQAYPVSITIQQKPTLLTSLNESWAPIPDEYSHIFNWGLLSLLYMYADDPRFQLAGQKFIAHLLSTHQGLTQTQINIFLNNWQYLTGQPITNTSTIQQGYSARGSE
jgi:hypothetical protein